MELVCAVYAPNGRPSLPGLNPRQPMWYYESSTKLSVSSRNVAVFTSAYPLDEYASLWDKGVPPISGSFQHRRRVAPNVPGSFARSDNGLRHVFVADMNVPWEVFRVTSKACDITTLSWDPATGSESFVLSDAEGCVEAWSVRNSVLSDWVCVAKWRFEDEHFLVQKFLTGQRSVCHDLDREDDGNSALLKDKFVQKVGPEMFQSLEEQNMSACLLISSTGLAAVVVYENDKDDDVGGHAAGGGGPGRDDSGAAVGDLLGAGGGDGGANGGRGGAANGPTLATGVGGTVRCMSAVRCLSLDRTRIKCADISFLKCGKLLVATSDGHPGHPISCYSVSPRIGSDPLGFSWNHLDGLNVEPYPNFFVNSKGASAAATAAAQPSSSGAEADDQCQDQCQAIVCLHFVGGVETDTILVSIQCLSGGGKVEEWELRETVVLPHKIFLLASEGSQQPPGAKQLIVPVWECVDSLGGLKAPVHCISSPVKQLQTGKAATCHIALGDADASIHLLLSSTFRPVSGAELPRCWNSREGYGAPEVGQPVTKKCRRGQGAVICDMQFSANGSMLVILDSLGQLYYYRPSDSPSPASLAASLEGCLVSSRDCWDVLASMKHSSQMEAVADIFCEAFQKQPPTVKQHFASRFISIRCYLLRIAVAVQAAPQQHPVPHHRHQQLIRVGPPPDSKGSDSYTQLLLSAVHVAFRSLLRPCDLNMNDSAFDKVSQLLQHKMKDNDDVDKLVKLLMPINREFVVEQSILQSFQQLIQWTANLALHLMASVPEVKEAGGSAGQGASLLGSKQVLGMLRELLLLIRLWGVNCPGVKPSFMKTSDCDVLQTLFQLITKYINNPADETVLEKCLLLPSQVFIPPRKTLAVPRGVVPVLAAQGRCPAPYEFGIEPDHDSLGAAMAGSTAAPGSAVDSGSSRFVGSAVGGVVDCVRQTYLGGRPISLRHCTRCHGVSLPAKGDPRLAPNRAWDNRWAPHCPCGGSWIISVANN